MAEHRGLLSILQEMNKPHHKKVTFNSEILGVNHTLPIYVKVRMNITYTNICLFV